MACRLRPRTKAAAACAALLVGAGVALAVAESPAPVVEPEPSPEGRAMALTWELIADHEPVRADVAGLAERVLDLSPQQREQVRELGREHEREKARLLAELREEYAGKVAASLQDAQGEKYDRVLGAVEELVAAQRAARAHFLEALGPDAEQTADEDPFMAAADPVRFLPVEPEVRQQVRRLRMELFDSQGRALLERIDTENWQDIEAWRAQREKYVDRRREASQEYEERLGELLSAEQRKQLERIEAAAAEYRLSLQRARLRAYDRIYGVLRPAPAEGTEEADGG